MYVSSLDSVFEHYYEQKIASTYTFWLHLALKYSCMSRLPELKYSCMYTSGLSSLLSRSLPLSMSDSHEGSKGEALQGQHRMIHNPFPIEGSL